MLYFILGIIVGIILAFGAILVAVRVRQPVERSLKQFESRARPKGTILEPQSEELEHFLNKLNEGKTS